jgi:hypothetical protein
VSLLMDEVERAQSRLVSLEREKVTLHVCILALGKSFALIWLRCLYCQPGFVP